MKAKARNPASAIKMQASILNKKTLARNGFIVPSSS